MPKTCTVKACDREPYAKGLCGAHYRRQLRNPDADIAAPVRASRGELVDLSTRVPAEVRVALEEAGGAYAMAAAVLEAWATGAPLPKRTRRKRAA